ncbi:transmembrane protein, putative [Bodo saltans]|uniref:Transmembrane protein, putative n=1 Tax=Bodo saltans TaxID=75058 RepID=A0A0S4J1U1_BODSA|nr:transmembrane protein, putative [Bodo saltans]|eukprot:CUG49661.1 transmembrane protein, putative [Bodo saltans]
MNSRAFIRIVAALTVGWILFLLCEEVSRGFRRQTSHSAKLFQSPFDSIAASRHSDRLEDSCVVFSDDMLSSIDHDDSSDNYNDDRKPLLFSTADGVTGSTADHQQRRTSSLRRSIVEGPPQESCVTFRNTLTFYVDHSSSTISKQ